MKILIDMNLSPRWSWFLRRNGLEAVHWSEIGVSTAPDHEIMAYAKEHGWIVLTHDLDFSDILAATQGMKPSVIQIRSDSVSLEHIGQSVVQAIQQASRELGEGALLSIDPKRARLRLLPLQPSRHTQALP